MVKRSVQSDAALVRRVLAGRREDFGVLVERHLPAVFAVAYGRTGNHADAEDAAQETFLRALKTLDRLREPAKFGPWLLSIGRHVATDTLITRTRERNAGADTPTTDDACWIPNMEQREMWSKLHEQIRQLDDEPREVLLLFYFAGNSTKEIAALLDISHEAVRKRLQRARETLGTRMLEELQPERKLQSVLKKRGAVITAAVITAPVAWQTASAANIPVIAGAVTGKWLAGAVVVAVGLVGLFVATRDNREPTPPAQETAITETQPVTSTHQIAQPRVEADNRRPLSDAVDRAVEPVALQTPLPAADTIHGRVVDAKTGRGVSLGVTLSGGLVGDNEVVQETDDDGTFQFDLSQYDDGAYAVSCGNDGHYAYTSVNGVRRSGEPIPDVMLEVHELATISGYVLRPDGSPVPYASIWREELGEKADTIGSADENGHYVIHHEGGRLTLGAHQSMLMSGFKTFDLAKDESVTHDFILPESGEIRITLQTSDGAPVEDIRRSALMTKDWTTPSLNADRVGDNQFLVKNLPYDVYTMVIRATGYEPAEIADVAVNEQQPETSVSTTLQRAMLYNVAVRVLDPNGNPLPDTSVVLKQLTERVQPGGNVGAKLENEIGQNGLKTDAKGEWSTSVPGGYYRASCDDAAGKGETYITVPDERTALLRLARPDSIKYRLEVVDGLDNNKPLSSADVHTFFVHGDGTIAKDPAPGTNHIVVVKEGYTAYLDTIDVNPASSNEPVVIRAVLGKGGTIVGTLRTANDSRKVGPILRVYPELLWRLAADPQSDSWVQLGRTLSQGAAIADDGMFSINHLPQGRYVVVLSDGTASAPVDVVPSGASEFVEIVSE